MSAVAIFGLGARVVVSSGPTPEEELIALLSGKAECGFFDMREASIVSSKVRVLNKAGGLEYYEAPDPSNNPGLDTVNGLYFDGNSTQLMGAAAITPSDVLSIYMLLKKDPTDSGQSRIFSGGYTIYEDGSGSGMAINFSIGGVVRSTYDALHDALDDGAWHILSATGANSNFGSGLHIGGGFGTSMHANLKALVIINEASFTAPELTEARAAAVAYMESIL